MGINPFLNQLLQYEQDGKSAVSSPTNWNEKPLLQVRTEIDDLTEELVNDLMSNETLLRWHFFIGSPGNGKSAAVGRLFQMLCAKNIVFKTKDKEIYSVGNNILPYLLEGYHENKSYSFCYLAQDASVVENPFAIEISPAKDLLLLIKDAWEKGKSLIICANRGIIEEAIRIGEEKEEFKNQKWFRKAFLPLSKSEKDEIEIGDNRPRSNSLRLKYTSSVLDFRSIVLTKPNGNNIFANLIEEATKKENWTACDSCSSKNICPFKANRDHLSTAENSAKFVTLVKRAEVYSGQVIVFREALALIAFILAGCSEDLIKEKVQSPCEWVQNKISKEQVFDLLGRRIYMCLFSSFSPYGFEFAFNKDTKKNITSTQKEALKEDASLTRYKKTFLRLLKDFSQDWLTLNVGLTRLLSEKGVFRDLHPIYGIPLNNYENEIQKKWDLQLETLIADNLNSSLITEIEKRVFAQLKELEEAIVSSNENIAQKLSWLSRWISNVTYNIGILDSCIGNFDVELDRLIQAFEKPASEESRNIKRQLKESIKKIFDEENNRMIQVTKNMAISNFDIDTIKIDIPTDENRTYGLTMQFGNRGSAPIIINIQTFCWLIRKLTSRLSSSTFPKEYLDTLRVSQLKAAKDLQYNTKPDLELRIKTIADVEYSVKREDGEIYLDYITKIE
jgi:hypothetical protein